MAEWKKYDETTFTDFGSVGETMPAEGGEAGGFAEKTAAAKETGTELIVLRRPEENGLSFDEVLNRCMTRLRVEI